MYLGDSRHVSVYRVLTSSELSYIAPYMSSREETVQETSGDQQRTARIQLSLFPNQLRNPPLPSVT